MSLLPLMFRSLLRLISSLVSQPTASVATLLEPPVPFSHQFIEMFLREWIDLLLQYIAGIGEMSFVV
ncbi:hypothetical protein OIU84_022909 [Salix udensis]|uniref:Secreted protein n=1 Tax=Salix udensis TaxID=889485 RepID=A0AAD6PFR7_9ROSI|nr:hypothetical protein OIU84_022909 [Salix udensis]